MIKKKTIYKYISKSNTHCRVVRPSLSSSSLGYARSALTASHQQAKGQASSLKAHPGDDQVLFERRAP